jgi:hypothetical protein
MQIFFSKCHISGTSFYIITPLELPTADDDDDDNNPCTDFYLFFPQTFICFKNMGPAKYLRISTVK